MNIPTFIFKKCNRKTTLLICFLLTFGYAKSQRIAIISIPKCGTHLLNKALIILTNTGDIYMGFSNFGCYTKAAKWHHIYCKYKEGKKPNLIKCHTLYDESILKDLLANNYKVVFIYRDPRDQIVSMAHFIPKMKDVWPELTHIDKNQLITDLINNCRAIQSKTVCSIKKPIFKTIADFYKEFLGWKDKPEVNTVKFENLIGSQGGGSTQTQKQELANLASFLKIDTKYEKLEEISNKLFGGTWTFNQGQIGSWKKHFTKEHKKAFKEVAGQLLIDLGYEKDLNW